MINKENRKKLNLIIKHYQLISSRVCYDPKYPLVLKCRACGHITSKQVTSWLHDSECKKCKRKKIDKYSRYSKIIQVSIKDLSWEDGGLINNSRGEYWIKYLLDKVNIPYIQQYKPRGLKDLGQLSYDFYIPGKSILIEYQGIQHYKPVPYLGGKQEFKIQQKHDRIKYNYAKKQGFKLLYINTKSLRVLRNCLANNI